MLLAHLSDLHFGDADETALGAVRSCLEQRRPDAVIVTGDISRAGLAKELEAAFEWIRALPAPALVVPGNHDVPYYNLLGRLLDPFGRFDRAAVGVRLTPWHSPRWSVTPLNTARGMQPRFNWAQGALSLQQSEQAIGEIRSAAPGALNIVATHHPLDWPRDAPISGRTWGGRAAQSAFVEAGARVFLSGHLHVARIDRIEDGRGIAVCAGTLSRRLRNEQCGFGLLRHPSPSEVEVEFLQVRGARAVTIAEHSLKIEQS